MSGKLICAFFFVVLTGCVPNANDISPSESVSDYFQMSTSEQVKQFKNYSLDEQYELFLFGNQVVHPPATYLARPFANQGPIIVPYLRAKLETKQNDVTVRDITLVFLWMAQLKIYDFTEDPELMGLLERKANEMGGIWKETTLKLISEIGSSGRK